MSNLKVDIDSSQILIIKKELVKDFVINEYTVGNIEAKQRLADNKLEATYTDCCAVTSSEENRTKVVEGVFCVNTDSNGGGRYFFEVNPSDTDYCGGSFIGFTEESTGFMYTVDNPYEGDDPEEDPSEYVEFTEETGTVHIEEEGEYVIGDPCSISEEDSCVYLKSGYYDICFFDNQVEY